MRFFNKKNAKEMGKKGGKKTYERHGIEHMRELGRSTVKRHGTEHMRKIGKVGFQATCNKYYNGDTGAMLYALREQGLINTADREMMEMLRYYQERMPELFE